MFKVECYTGKNLHDRLFPAKICINDQGTPKRYFVETSSWLPLTTITFPVFKKYTSFAVVCYQRAMKSDSTFQIRRNNPVEVENTFCSLISTESYSHFAIRSLNFELER